MSYSDRPHWSFSSLNQFLRCPLQYYFERILKLPRTSIPSSMVLGSALHQSLERYHYAIMQGQELSWDELQLEVLKSWLDRESQQTIHYKENENRQQCMELALELLRLYLQQPIPEKILWVEKPFMVPIRNSAGCYLETPLLAVADLITAVDSQWKVSEFKTAARAFGEFEISTSLQATCYAHAIQENFNNNASIEFVMFVKTKSPKIQCVTTARSDQDFKRLGDLVETIESAVEQELFYPIESPLNCSACPYRMQCLQWQPNQQAEELELTQIVEPSQECTCSLK